MNFISNYLTGDIPKHENIDFVNVNIDSDQRLFIDPILIEKNNTEFGIVSNRKIQSFFKKMYQLFNSDSKIEEKIALFSHSSEINYTHIGYALHKNGKGNTAEGMVSIFSGVKQYIKDFNLKHPFEAVLFTPNFAEDGLSDLITNIIFKELSEFTLIQCEKYGIETANSKKESFYWDDVSSSWKKYEGKSLIVDGEIVLLIPKGIVQKKYRFTTDSYIRSIIVENICESKAEYDKNGKKVRPKKDKIRAKLIDEYGSLFKISTAFTQKRPDNLEDYQKLMLTKYSDYALSDSQLDHIIYNKA